MTHRCRRWKWQHRRNEKWQEKILRYWKIKKRCILFLILFLVEMRTLLSFRTKKFGRYSCGNSHHIATCYSQPTPSNHIQRTSNEMPKWSTIHQSIAQIRSLLERGNFFCFCVVWHARKISNKTAPKQVTFANTQWCQNQRKMLATHTDLVHCIIMIESNTEKKKIVSYSVRSLYIQRKCTFS